MPAIDEMPMTRPPVRSSFWSSSSAVMRCGAPTLMSMTRFQFSVFMFLQPLVARDAGVVDDDVDAAVGVLERLRR